MAVFVVRFVMAWISDRVLPPATPYARYFLAHILQFQFHKAMLALGASRPWPEALQTLTGTREQNEGRTCGWKAP